MVVFMEEKVVTAVAAGERSERRCPPSPLAAPWLVFPYGKCGKNQAFHNLCEPNKKIYRKFIPEISYKSYWQKPCHQGWLVIVCDDDDGGDSNLSWNFGDCFLWNPLSLETIRLPTLLNWITNEEIFDCVLSSPPTNPDSTVFFLFTAGGVDSNDSNQKVVFCRPGGDKQWRTKELSVEKKSARGLVCFEGNNNKLYIMCLNTHHLEIEILWSSNNNVNDDDVTLLIKPFNIINEIPPPLVISLYNYQQSYYVGSCDDHELFHVLLYSHPTSYEKQVTAFQVLRLNSSLMAWEEVKDLGDHVLFLGLQTRACCSAAELGLKRGCGFFTLPKDKSLYKFDLEDGTISVDLPCPNLPTPWFSPEWMIIPTTGRATDGPRKPEDLLGNIDKEDIIIEVEKIKASFKNDDKEEKEEVHKIDGRKLNELGTWNTLSKNNLELIATYLHPVDYLHFRAVCKVNLSASSPALSWRNSSVAAITGTTCIPPWLVFFKTNNAIYNFLDPMHDNEKYFMDLPDLLLDTKIRFSKGGWLLMSKGEKTLFFLNPFTRAKIQLPDLPENYIFSGISFSSLPTCSDCVVFAIADTCTDISIYFISRTNDCWSSCIIQYSDSPLEKECMEYTPCYNNPVFYNGVFYCLSYNGALGAFDLNDDFTWKFLAKPQRPCNSIYQSFLVECEGKLLAVFLGHLGKWVRIFKLDLAKMEWVKVESLGRHMLFISNTSCLSAVAPKSHNMKNKIYFPRFHGERIIFYSLETGMFHSLASRYSAQDFYKTKEQLYCSWIEPNWLQTTDEELDWRVALT